MKSTHLTVGTRPSKLAITQTKAALEQIKKQFPQLQFALQPITSTGDQDRTLDLRESPADFFSRELDEALLSGKIDCAIHSAKDLPPTPPDGIDTFWLPWNEDPRDTLIFQKGKTRADLPASPKMGISSQRRADYCSTHFPNGIPLTIRGNIEERLAQLDEGKYDLLIMAIAALNRLGLQDRIDQPIETSELPVPDAQGYLALSIRNHDSTTAPLRTLAPLHNRKILLTCSEILQTKATRLINNMGGTPLPFPLIQIKNSLTEKIDLTDYSWLVLTSPSAVRSFFEQFQKNPLPKLLICGSGTAEELARHGIVADAMPSSEFNTDAIAQRAKTLFTSNDRVLRLRSQKAGTKLTDLLRETGATVHDHILYQTLPTQTPDQLPDFDTLFFASSSAVELFFNRYPIPKNKTVLAIGKPTAEALKKAGRPADLIPEQATLLSSFQILDH